MMHPATAPPVYSSPKMVQVIRDAPPDVAGHDSTSSSINPSPQSKDYFIALRNVRDMLKLTNFVFSKSYWGRNQPRISS